MAGENLQAGAPNLPWSCWPVRTRFARAFVSHTGARRYRGKVQKHLLTLGGTAGHYRFVLSCFISLGLFLFAKMTPQYYKIQEDRLFCIWRGKQHAALFYGYGYLIYFV